MTDQDLDRALAALKADNGEHLGFGEADRVMAASRSGRSGASDTRGGIS